METEGRNKFNTKAREFFSNMPKTLRLVKISREFWIFLLFLAASIAFWCVQTIKEETTLSVDYSLVITNVPANEIITSELPDRVTVTMTGKGFSILEYIFKFKQPIVTVDYSSLVKTSDKAIIDMPAWRKSFSMVLSRDMVINSVTPAPLDIYYSQGFHKQVPVVFKGNIKTSSDYSLCDVELTPKFVDVYAPSSLLDSIKFATTEDKFIRNLKDTTNIKLAITPIHGIKFVPDSIEAKLCIDLMTSKTLQVPIYSNKVPEGQVLRTFPSTAEVTFKINSAYYNLISPSDFSLTVEYPEENLSDNNRLNISLSRKPDGISSVSISPKSVEYIIEK